MKDENFILVVALMMFGIGVGMLMGIARVENDAIARGVAHYQTVRIKTNYVGDFQWNSPTNK